MTAEEILDAAYRLYEGQDPREIPAFLAHLIVDRLTKKQLEKLERDMDEELVRQKELDAFDEACTLAALEEEE